MKKTIAMCITMISVLVLPVFAADKGLTEDTGQQILKELREIRQVLEKQQRPQSQQPQAPPKPEKVKVKDGGTRVLGKKEAPVTLILYTDFQCPYCSRFENGAFPDIRKNLIDTGKVRFIQRDLALDFHPFALKAAQAARCAEEQGKFWDMSAMLFKNQQKLDGDSMAGYAKDLGLNADKYKACTSGDKYLKEIKEEGAAANAIGISGTPSFVLGKVVGDMVDGVKVVGALPYQAFEAQINELLGAGAK